MLIGVDASRAFVAQSTGTEHYSFHIIRALIQTRGERRLRLYSRTPPPTEIGSQLPISRSVESVVLPFPRMWTHLRLASELWQRPPDVLFVPAHVLPLVCGVPSVVTIHDLGYLHLPDTHPRLERWYLDWSTRRHARIADRLIADSEATRRDLIQCYNADPERIRVVYPGRDESLLPVTNRDEIERVNSRYNISGNYLLYLGTIRPRKNLSRLIEGFAHVKREMDNSVLLVLAGKPSSYSGELARLAARLGISDAVLFPGYIHSQDKAALLSGALGLVFPSLYEGFGLPVLEAMTCGVPVLTSNVSSLPEVAGEAAILVDPTSTQQIAQGIGRLITDTDLRQKLVAQGYQQVEQFSWTSAALQLWAVFEAVCGSRGKRHG